MGVQNISTRREVPSDRDRIFASLLDVETYPKWLVGVAAAPLESGRAGREGAVHTLEFRIGTLSERERFVLRDVDEENRSLVLAKARPGKIIELAMRVDSHRAGAKILLGLRHEYEVKVLGMSVTGPLFRRFLLLTLDRSLRTLAAQLRS